MLIRAPIFPSDAAERPRAGGVLVGGLSFQQRHQRRRVSSHHLINSSRPAPRADLAAEGVAAGPAPGAGRGRRVRGALPRGTDRHLPGAAGTRSVASEGVGAACSCRPAHARRLGGRRSRCVPTGQPGWAPRGARCPPPSPPVAASLSRPVPVPGGPACRAAGRPPELPGSGLARGVRGSALTHAAACGSDVFLR